MGNAQGNDKLTSVKAFALVLLITFVVRPLALGEPLIFLVRHAEKARDGDVKDPELSPAGHTRAKALASILKDANIRAIYATEFKRTQQTAEPLAHALGLQIIIVPAHETNALVSKIREGNGNALVVGHSNTIPEIAKSLGIANLPEITEADYGMLFVFAPGSPAQLVQLHYQ